MNAWLTNFHFKYLNVPLMFKAPELIKNGSKPQKELDGLFKQKSFGASHQQMVLYIIVFVIAFIILFVFFMGAEKRLNNKRERQAYRQNENDAEKRAKMARDDNNNDSDNYWRE